MSLRITELERAVHVERENMREKIKRNRQEAFRSEKQKRKGKNGWVLGQKFIANDEEGWRKRETVDKWPGTASKSTGADIWVSRYKVGRDASKTHPGYHEQIGPSPRR